MANSYFLILAIAVLGASAQIQFPGSCSSVDETVVDPFNVAAYLGKWYEVEAYLQVFSLGGMCVSANYSLNDDGTVKVYNTLINEYTGGFNSITGSARLTDGTAGKLAVTFPVAPGEAPYWVLDTDYTSYSIVWACRDYGNVHFATAWYLSRERNPSEQQRNDVRSIFMARGINTDQLKANNQTGCPAETERLF